jgi:hypothetical protein
MTFFGKTGRNMKFLRCFSCQKFYFSVRLFQWSIMCLKQRYRMQKLRAWEVDVLPYPNEGPHHFWLLHLLGLVFWMYSLFDIPVYCNMPSEPHCNHLLANDCTVVTYLLRDKPPPFQQYCFPLHFTVSSYFLIE